MSASNLRKTYTLFYLLTAIFLESFGQTPATLQLTGVVKDTNDEALKGATLFLKNGNDGTLVKQLQSNEEGNFSFNASPGNYLLAISYLGKLAYQSEPFKLSGKMDFGVIKINTSALHLREVIIQLTVNKPLIKVEGRKMIFDVEKSITSQGTDALEALKKTPGVMVSQDNSITLNGTNGALVMINGRQTYLQADDLAQLLKATPAAELKSIEVIKNPSAEYDAAGTGGIINLVLKKSLAEGFNGSVNSGIAYGVSLKQNTNLSLNYRKGKINLFGSYNHNFGHYAMEYDTDRTTNGKVYLNANHDIDKKYRLGSTLGLDYAVDSTKIIGMIVNANYSSGGGIIIPVTNIYSRPTGELLQTLRSESTYPDQLAIRYSANINYRYKGSNGTNLDLDADYGFFDASTRNLSNNTFYGADGTFQSSNNFLVANSRDIRLYALKADYGFPAGAQMFMTGVKFSSVGADNVFNQYDVNSGIEVIDIERSNTFDYNEQISSGYLKYEANFSKFLSMDAGLRLEHTHSTGNLQPNAGSSQEASKVSRNYLDIFPTASVTYKTPAGTFNLSFARRVDRPAYNNLNPFAYPVDELSYWKGNPFLQPQYANALVVQYSYKKTTVATGYTHTSDISSRITEVLEDNVINMIPRNIGFQENVNLTITQQLAPARWWNVSLTGIGYRLKNKVGTEVFGNFNRSRLAGRINIQQTFNLPGGFTAELASMVNSKNISGLNTYVKGNSQIDLGLQKNLIQDKATLRLAFSDVFRGNKTITDAQLDNLLLHTTYAGETRQVRLNFTYRFGNKKIKMKDNRKSGLENESQRL